MDFQEKKQLPPAIVGSIEEVPDWQRVVNDTELVGRKIEATPDFVANVASLVTHTSPAAFPTTASASSKSAEMLPGKQCPVEKVTRSICTCLLKGNRAGGELLPLVVQPHCGGQVQVQQGE